MFFQTDFESQREFFQLMRWVMPIIIAILLVYAVFSLIKFLQKRSKISFYFSLSNFSYVFAMIALYIGHLDNLANDAKTTLYFYMVMVMNIFMILNALFLYAFHAAVNAVPRKNQLVIYIAGVIIVAFMLLPQNGWADPANTGFKLMYISFLLLTAYSLYVYLTVAITFYRLARKAQNSMQAELEPLAKPSYAISIGGILMIVFFVLMLVRTFLDSLVLQLSSFLMLLIALGLFFYGYYQPAFKK